MDARKEAMGKQKALELASTVDEIYAAKGTKIVHLDLKREKHDAEEIAAVLLGPTGNLRAPAIKQGRKLIVGFNEETYRQLLN